MTRNITRAALAATTALLLAGCTETHLRLSPDFGEAVHQNQVAQTADPDAHYEGVPAPGSSGARAAAANGRYNRDQVIPPASASTSTVSIGGGASSSPASPTP
ncbi:hypothetical protein ACO2Q3_25585 [Caulobacter sp. KR2-114]|uniref:hypothetical protein n=1 Tax=Caulobacter sp. KR2-114 TaxID=3400912 RepID=UPI003C1136D2